MKVAVSIPDPLFVEAERLAKRLRLSRSQLYARALEMLVNREDDSDITKRLDAVYRQHDLSADTGLINAQADAVREN